MNQGSGAHQAPGPPRILVLGIGNVLLTDEGVGVRAIEALKNSFDFSDNVTLMDGGTLGLGLLDAIMESDALIVIDAVRAARPPGTLHRLTENDLHPAVNGRNSLHEVAFAETLNAARLLGKTPEVVILGIEPENIGSWSTRLTETIERRIPDLVAAALCELRRMGGRLYRRKHPPQAEPLTSPSPDSTCCGGP